MHDKNIILDYNLKVLESQLLGKACMINNKKRCKKIAMQWLTKYGLYNQPQHGRFIAFVIDGSTKTIMKKCWQIKMKGNLYYMPILCSVAAANLDTNGLLWFYKLAHALLLLCM